MPPLSKSVLEQTFQELWEWCRKHDFAGHDPFDALNSRLFQSLPFSETRFARLAWTQLLKRTPFNLRNLTRVPKEKNAKGIALFALAVLSHQRATPSTDSEVDARIVIDQLLKLKIAGWSGAAWGYNFDWQSRYFFAPRGTPTIVPTAFAARALIEGYEAFGDHQLLQDARSVCDFVLQDLPHSVDSDLELCFGYAPRAETKIFNASLLAGEVLAAVGSRTAERALLNDALRVARYVIRQQGVDGSWTYGADVHQQRVDNFHTAFVLSSLVRIIRCIGIDKTSELHDAVLRGYRFWRARFFLADGWPKYYDDAPYPGDVHAAAAAIITLCDMRNFDQQFTGDALPLAEVVAQWAIANLRAPKGYFYYQRRRLFTVKTPFMRWGQAWMCYALARLLEEK